ncbi:hypothetical protein EVAR_74883_1 [Eumeta japonica]|uniref:Uncharacterized protein n=1 Tax=Eumeta variegata TaxID=151549 RepID=A0A4C1YYR1_EUMVA|nr:hypothetical protein EVAR_74883_1 [Eumeta japonica]
MGGIPFLEPLGLWTSIEKVLYFPPFTTARKVCKDGRYLATSFDWLPPQDLLVCDEYALAIIPGFEALM